jgi:hypothetical protein
VEVESAGAPLGAGLNRGGRGVCKAPKREACKHCKLHWICHGERELQQGGLKWGWGE